MVSANEHPVYNARSVIPFNLHTRRFWNQCLWSSQAKAVWYYFNPTYFHIYTSMNTLSKTYCINTYNILQWHWWTEIPVLPYGLYLNWAVLFKRLKTYAVCKGNKSDVLPMVISSTWRTIWKRLVFIFYGTLAWHSSHNLENTPTHLLSVKDCTGSERTTPSELQWFERPWNKPGARFQRLARGGMEMVGCIGLQLGPFVSLPPCRTVVLEYGQLPLSRCVVGDGVNLTPIVAISLEVHLQLVLQVGRGHDGRDPRQQDRAGGNGHTCLKRQGRGAPDRPAEREREGDWGRQKEWGEKVRGRMQFIQQVAMQKWLVRDPYLQVSDHAVEVRGHLHLVHLAFAYIQLMVLPVSQPFCNWKIWKVWNHMYPSILPLP